jgi:uncharacterized membrane protein
MNRLSRSTQRIFAVFVRLVVVAMIATTAPAVRAAYFDIVPENVNYLNNPLEDIQFEPRCNLVMSGTIDGNTVADFENAVKELDARTTLKRDNDFLSPLEKQPGFRALCMSSSGGRLHDALDLIPHLDRWIAVVPQGALCESACAIAFMGAGLSAGPYGDMGVSSTNRRQARFLHYTGILSFHAPTLEDLPDGTITKDQLLKEYEQSRLTMGRILFLRGWDILVRNQRGGAATPDLSTGDSIERMLSRADVDPFLPASLFFTFLVTPNKSAFHVQTVEQALVWGIQIYGLSRKTLDEDLPEFWFWRTCENLAWMMCHNPSQLSDGCNTIGVGRKTFADTTTLPYIIENRGRSGIEQFTQRLSSGSASEIKRIALGNNDQKSHHAYGSGEVKAECGISLYSNHGLIGMRAEYHPTGNVWAFGQLASSLIDKTESAWLGMSRMPPEFEKQKIIRPWMWLSMDTRLPEMEKKWSALFAVAANDGERLRRDDYHILNICNLTDGPLTISAAYKTGSDIVAKGWYHLEVSNCIVPEGIDTGHTFYVHARDASGREVAVPGTISQQWFCVRRNTDFSISQPEGNGACAKTNLEADDFAAFSFSRISTKEIVTLIIFGVLPKGVSVNDPQRSSFQDVGKGIGR